jgi:hypothetical protein
LAVREKEAETSKQCAIAQEQKVKTKAEEVDIRDKELTAREKKVCYKVWFRAWIVHCKLGTRLP